MNCSPPGFSTEFSRQEYWSGLPFPIPWESSCPSDQTPVSFISCFGRQILYHECRPEKSHKVTEKKNCFFLVMTAFKIYSCGTFQICSTVLLTLVTRLYAISPWLTHFVTGSLFLLTPWTLFAPLPHQLPSGTHRSILRLLVFFCLLVCFMCRFHI